MQIDRPFKLFFASAKNAALSLNVYISANVSWKCLSNAPKFKLDITACNKGYCNKGF